MGGMGRPLYIEVPDGIFHLNSRGNARRTIFEDDEDHRVFLAHLRFVLRRHGWECIAYCLMRNHFHLVVRTPQPNLADGMRDLKSGYATAYNKRRGIDGSLFKRGYWPQLIQEDEYLITAVTYVVLNPLRAGLVSDPMDWPWSSIQETVNDTAGFVNAVAVLQLLHPNPDEARGRFRNLANAVGGLPSFDPTLPIVGDKSFVRTHAPETRPGRHVAKTAWEQARPTLAELRDGRSEIEFICDARRTYRYTLIEIAAMLGCNERTVRRRLQMSGAGTAPL